MWGKRAVWRWRWALWATPYMLLIGVITAVMKYGGFSKCDYRSSARRGNEGLGSCGILCYMGVGARLRDVRVRRVLLFWRCRLTACWCQAFARDVNNSPCMDTGSLWYSRTSLLTLIRILKYFTSDRTMWRECAVWRFSTTPCDVTYTVECSMCQLFPTKITFEEWGDTLKAE